MKRTADVVIIGAGIAGVAAAYHLAVRRGIRRIAIVDALEPLNLTSNKGTQGYRNWWPGPDATMLQMVSRSIDIVEEIARESGNAIRLSRRGYVFATARDEQVDAMRSSAAQVSGFGMGELREHNSLGEYRPAPAEGFEDQPTGADLLLGDAALRAFPYLNPGLRAVLHIRRAGWMNAVVLGTWSLSRAIASGAQFVRGKVVGINLRNGGVSGVRLENDGEIETGQMVIAAGPMLPDILAMLDVKLPLLHELHAKVTFRDSASVLPRSAPFLIWNDPVLLDWTPGERRQLQESGRDSRLLEEMPGGVHVRPVDAVHGDEMWLIWTYENEPCTPEWPPRYNATYAAAVMRSCADMVPAMAAYGAHAARGMVDGGYYCKTRENRPLAGPLPVSGAYVCGALSGYGVMAAHAVAELVATHVAQDTPAPWAKWFLPSRYDDPAYLAMIDGWGATVGQL